MGQRRLSAGGPPNLPLRFSVLGPLQVLAGRHVLAAGGPKHRALLGALVVHAGEAVSVDLLVDALWDGVPPRSAINTLQGYVSDVRRTLEPGRGPRAESHVLVTEPTGYRLAVPAEHIDAREFERLAARGQSALAQGRPQEASAHLGEALALWRGPALANFSTQNFARAPAQRLEEARLAAIEDGVEARLTLGHHSEVIAEIRALLDDHPFRERLSTQLITACYRAGRQADALAVYRATRTRLRDQLGIEPGPALQRVHEAVLRQDPDLDRPAVPELRRPRPRRVPHPVPPTSAPLPLTSFVGRASDRTHILEQLAWRRLVTLTGPGGVGKSRLAQELARDARGWSHARAHVVTLHEVEDEAALPARVGAALGVKVGGRSGLTSLVASLRDRELLLVLDGCEQLIRACRRLIRASLDAGSGVHVLATSRERLGVPGEVVWRVDPLSTPEPHRSWTADRLTAYESVQLFADRAACAVPDWTLDDTDAPAVASICAQLDGLPLAVELATERLAVLSPRELAERLRGGYRRDEATGFAALPQQRRLLDSMERSYALLSEPEARLARRLSVLEGDFTLAAAEQAGGVPAVTLEQLSRLVDKSVVLVVARRPTTRYRMLRGIRDHLRSKPDHADEDLQ